MNCSMKKCCWCLSLRTGSILIATIGILFTVTALIPHCQLIRYHDFYIKEYVKRQRAEGLREISDEDIPKIDLFSKVTWSLVIAYDAVFIFFSLLLLIGVVASIRLLMIPWMFLTIITTLFNVVFVLSFMFALENFGSIITFVITFPFFAFVIYIWFAIYSTYRELGPNIPTEVNTKEETRGLVSDIEVGVINSRTLLESSPSITVITNHHHHGHHSPESRVIALSGSRHSVVSSSTSSVKSETGLLRGNHIQRAILGTPPPPYEVVALSKNKVFTMSEEDSSKDESKEVLCVNKSNISKLTLTPMSSISSSSSASEKVSPQGSIEDVISSETDTPIKHSDESETVSQSLKVAVKNDEEEDMI